MADEKPTQKHFIIAGDDGTLYHLTQEELEAHRMDPNHPAHAQAQKLVAENKHGVIGPEHFTAQSATGAISVGNDISFNLLNSSAVKAEE